jgi:hypothetical protein
MPELNTAMPQWLQERAVAPWRGDPSVSHDIQAGAAIAQRNRQLAIQQTTALVENRQRDAHTTSLLLSNAEKAAEAEDMQWIQLAQRDYTHGNKEIEPALKSVQGQRLWATWKARFDAEQSDTFEYADFLKSYSALDGYGKAAVRAIGDLNKGDIKPEHYQILGNEQARIRDDALKSRYGTTTIEVDGVKYLRTATGALHAVPKDWSEGAPAVPIVDDDGNVLGYGLQNSRGGITQLRQPGTKRHPLQNKLDGLKSEMAGEEAAKHTLKAKQLQAEIAALEKTIAAEQAPSQSVRPNTPSVGDVLRYDPATRTFK